MKLNNFLTLICAGLLALASCSKSYLSTVQPADGSVADNIIFGSKVGADNAMTGIYYLFQRYASGQQNMYGLKTVQFNFDMRGNDLISDPANWWLYENNWADNTYGRIATATRNAQLWNLFYKAINNA